jgi:hypothetical protein
MDAATAELWQKAGWELGARPFESQEDAQQAMEQWKILTGRKENPQP